MDMPPSEVIDVIHSIRVVISIISFLLLRLQLLFRAFLASLKLQSCGTCEALNTTCWYGTCSMALQGFIDSLSLTRNYTSLIHTGRFGIGNGPVPSVKSVILNLPKVHNLSHEIIRGQLLPSRKMTGKGLLLPSSYHMNETYCRVPGKKNDSRPGAIGLDISGNLAATVLKYNLN